MPHLLDTMQSINPHADRDQVIEVLGAAMQHDRLARYIEFEHYDLPSSTAITVQQSELFFRELLESLYDAGAIFAETLDSGGVSVWTPPNFVWPEETGPYLSSSMQEYGNIAEGAKHRHLGTSPYWYLFLIGRDPSHVGKPIAHSLIQPFLQQAQKDRLPVWLEATSPKSRKIYESLGFKVAEELKVGKGRCTENGSPLDGGEGVTIWGMVADYR